MWKYGQKAGDERRFYPQWSLWGDWDPMTPHLHDLYLGHVTELPDGRWVCVWRDLDTDIRHCSDAPNQDEAMEWVESNTTHHIDRPVLLETEFLLLAMKEGM